MKASTRNIFLILGGLLIIVTAIVGLGLYKIYSFVSSGFNREVPEQIKEARVMVGADFLTRSDFYKVDKGGVLKAIGESASTNDEKQRERLTNATIARSIYNFSDIKVINDEVIAAAEFGGFVFDLDGNLKKQITFEPLTEQVKIGPIETTSTRSSFNNLQVIKLDRDNVGYLSYGVSGMRVFDGNGDAIWSNGQEKVDLGSLASNSEERYEKSTHVLEAAVGDLDGDGVSEYIVARKNNGIRVYDRSGTERWSRPDDFASNKLLVFDLDGDGKGELIELGAKISDANGNLIREMKRGKRDGVVLAKNKDDKVEFRFVDIYEGKLSYYGENGDVILGADTPLSSIKKANPLQVGSGEYGYLDDSDDVAFPKAALVKFRKDQPPYLAVIGAYIGIPRANFYVFDHAGKLVYHELLPEEAETIAVAPAGDLEQVLIGGQESIWRYTAR